jgi:hypothetical protein
MKTFIPQTSFRKIKGTDHGDMALFHPEMLAREIRKL